MAANNHSDGAGSRARTGITRRISTLLRPSRVAAGPERFPAWLGQSSGRCNASALPRLDRAL